jgi:copper resistance protein B
MSGGRLFAAWAISMFAWAPAGALAQTPPVPPVTEADRRAAFPDVQPHRLRDDDVNVFVLVDQIEWARDDGRGRLGWDAHGWIGRDLDRIWLRSEGFARGGSKAGEAHVMYGRAVARWWELVAGVRQEVGGGPARTWAAVGIQGRTPYWVEIEATGYVGEGGRTAAKLEIEHDLLFTDRLRLQPLVELSFHGRADPERGIGAGFSRGEYGLRFRYELRRELAPYAGVTWDRRYFGTAEAARESGEPVGRWRAVIGLRWWR